MKSGPEAAPGRSEAPIARPLARNIEALMERRAREMAEAGPADRLAVAIAGFAGSLWSVLVHSVIFGLWVLINLGIVPLAAPWDPELIILATIASVEAIFLTTFILINQNRLARTDDKRAELTLQISLLSEHEMTKLVELASAVAARLGVQGPMRSELEELAEEVAPEAVLDEIERQRRED
jgi:uncharacterized membrane protein